MGKECDVGLGLLQTPGKKIAKAETLAGVGSPSWVLQPLLPLHTAFGCCPLCPLLSSLAKGKPLVGISLPSAFLFGGSRDLPQDFGSTLHEFGCTLVSLAEIFKVWMAGL